MISSSWIVITIVFLTAPVWVGVIIGVVLGTIQGIAHSIKKPKSKGQHAAEAPNRKPARSMATEIRKRDKIDSGEVWEPGKSNENSIMELTDEEIERFYESQPPF